MNINNSGMPTYPSTTSRPESARRAYVGWTGTFGGSAIRAAPAGHRHSAAASNITPGLTQSGTIQQRGISATRTQVSAPTSYDLGSRMADFEQLSGKLLDIYKPLDEIPLVASLLANEELAKIKAFTPARIIRELKEWNRELQFSFDYPVFDSSQTITDEFAAHVLKEFKSKIDQLLSIPNLEQTLKDTFMAVAGMMPGIRANNRTYQDTRSVSSVTDQITMGMELQRLMNNSHDEIIHVLSMRQDSDAYQRLKSDLDLCIKDISNLQASRRY